MILLHYLHQLALSFNLLGRTILLLLTSGLASPTKKLLHQKRIRVRLLFMKKMGVELIKEMILDKIGFWNIRGMNNPNKQLAISKFLHQNKVGLFGLVETKIKEHDFQSVLHKLVVYGSNLDSERDNLWLQLTQLKDLCTKPWYICGDFNALLNYNERLGSDVSWNELSAFRQCLDYCEVTDIAAQGGLLITALASAIKGMRCIPGKQPLDILTYGVWILNSLILSNMNRIKWFLGFQCLFWMIYKMHLNPHDQTILQAEREAADSYAFLNKARISFLQQKTKTEWLKGVDENSKFIQNRVLQIIDGQGITHHDPQAIEKAFLDYYIDLLGPDGYTSQFFKDCWDTVGRDIYEAVQGFFTSGKLLKQVNTTIITLIPKVPNPKSVIEFRPIAYCNIIYKCKAKLLCNRLSEVLPELVSTSQGGFVKERTVVENVLICQDIVRLYNRKSASPRCLIKIDLKKAYDSVE
ncbi:uncharacterized protein LOC141640395 [Silene latifolia]|uniref:uncharacterized protein LOC141640395 n=1 Tax=Silene latifolia TaxID=37657 RepID=UPI003D76F2CC